MQFLSFPFLSFSLSPFLSPFPSFFMILKMNILPFYVCYMNDLKFFVE